MNPADINDARMNPADINDVPKIVEAQPRSAGLLPPRWWEQGNVAAEPMRADPILTISPQVAQVLNIGIDRLVDVTTHLREDHNYTRDRFTLARWNDERVRAFLLNVSSELGNALEMHGAVKEVGDAIVAVRSAVKQFLNEPGP